MTLLFQRDLGSFVVVLLPLTASCFAVILKDLSNLRYLPTRNRICEGTDI